MRGVATIAFLLVKIEKVPTGVYLSPFRSRNVNISDFSVGGHIPISRPIGYSQPNALGLAN